MDYLKAQEGDIFSEKKEIAPHSRLGRHDFSVSTKILFAWSYEALVNKQKTFVDNTYTSTLLFRVSSMYAINQLKTVTSYKSALRDLFVTR